MKAFWNIRKTMKMLVPTVFLGTLIGLYTCSKYEVKQTGEFSGEVQGIIFGNCVSCHAGGAAEFGFGVVDNPKAMIEQEYIIPGNAAESKIFMKISANPTYGARMPFGGPYLTPTQIASVAHWINSMNADGTQATPGDPDDPDDPSTPSDPDKPDTPVGPTYFTVAETHGNFISISPTPSVEVKDGETASFTVTVTAGHMRTDAVGGTCATGNWSGDVYTTGAVTAACSVAFSVAGQATLTLTAVNVVSTPAVDQVVDIGSTMSFSLVGKAVKPATDTTDITAANGAVPVPDPTYAVSTAVGGTCPAGTWSSGTYTTGTIISACTVNFVANNPCGALGMGVTAKFSDVSSVLTSGLRENGTSNGAAATCLLAGCHNGAVTTKAHFGTANGADATGAALVPDYLVIMAQSATSGTLGSTPPSNEDIGGLMVVPGDPLNSWLYRKTTTSWLGGNGDSAANGRGRMPRNATFLPLIQQNQDIICNWIFDGAQNN
jgi:hypothetical protein